MIQHATAYGQLPRHLLLTVEISKSSNAVMLVVGRAQLQGQCGGGSTEIFGQQGLQVSLSCKLLLLQIFQRLGSLLERDKFDTCKLKFCISFILYT